MSQENVELVRGIYDTFANDDLEGWLAAWDPKCDWFPSMASLVEDAGFRGDEGLRRYWVEAKETWEGHRVVADELRPVGDRVVAIGRAYARGKQSGVPVDRPVAHVFTIRDGKILRGEGFASRAAALEAVGLHE